MSLKTTRIFYWTTFALSVIILPLNIGLGLFATGIFILPVLILHVMIGFGLDVLKDHPRLIVLSPINLLVFVLIRPDGVHTLTDSGMSAVLRIFGIHAGYSYKYEDYFFFGSLILLGIQLIIDLRLRTIIRAGDYST